MSSSSPVPSPVSSCEPKQWRASLLDNYDTIVFDCDGVLWRGGCLLPAVAPTISTLLSAGKQVLFCSNNSTLSRTGFVAKFASFGLTVPPAHVYSSASTVASLILADSSFNPATDKVFVIGLKGLKDSLKERGIMIVDSNDVAPPTTTMAELGSFIPDPSITAVVVGLDPQMSYQKAAYATTLLLERGCRFYATNRDRTYPASKRKLPGAGCCVAMVAAAAGMEPTVAGKPSQAMFKALAADHGITPGRTLMVGDRLDTDIAFAEEAGMDSVLVFTGVTDEKTFFAKLGKQQAKAEAKAEAKNEAKAEAEAEAGKGGVSPVKKRSSAASAAGPTFTAKAMCELVGTEYHLAVAAEAAAAAAAGTGAGAGAGAGSEGLGLGLEPAAASQPVVEVTPELK